MPVGTFRFVTEDAAWWSVPRRRPAPPSTPQRPDPQAGE